MLNLPGAKFIMLTFGQMRGSTMGSRKEFKELVQYIADKRIVPVVDSVHSLEDVEKAFQVMKAGTNFGKMVIQVQRDTAKI